MSKDRAYKLLVVVLADVLLVAIAAALMARALGKAHDVAASVPDVGWSPCFLGGMAVVLVLRHSGVRP